ncbi:3-oxoacyl-ACP synthase [Maribacter halichondriae]|uniref:3-oxoacyl-ACP synthase n=1 Tax=Maribacter halichondriae TaxID=2980554 RepID=UPI002359894C|nr:3-oxoacyl-ACP synthase [Maribacter sp. Hal144]
MNKNNHIKSYCHINEGIVSLNGKAVYENISPDFASFIKSAYHHFETDYSKFFKMDNLSKLAFMAAEVLLQEKSSPEQERNMAIVLSNRASSLDTDRKYQESIADENNFYPSPAVFVYTLPNICIGEISIRHKLHSENSFFIFDAFNADYIKEYSDSLLDTEKADEVLCGWVDFDEGRYEAFLYIVSHQGSHLHTKEEITRLYLT